MENDFIVLLNDSQIKCNKNFVESNFPEFYQLAEGGNQAKVQIEEGNNFYEVTKNIFQGNNYEITSDNFKYLEQLSQQLQAEGLQTKLNSFCYKRECDNNQIDQHPSIQFLIEISTLIHKLTITNYEDISSQIKQKLMPIINQNNESDSGSQTNISNEKSDKGDDSENEEESGDESEEENEEDKILSLKKVGSKTFNNLLFFEIVNYLSTGFNSIQQLQEKQQKVQTIIQLIQELDLEDPSRDESTNKKVLLDNFINYIIEKYAEIKSQNNSISNYRQEILYLIHYLLSNKLIKLSQIHQSKDPIELYFIEFFDETEINNYFSNNEAIVEFFEKQIDEPKSKNKSKTKKNQQSNEDNKKNALLVDYLSKAIKNGLIDNNEVINIMLNDNLSEFKKSFDDESINSFVFPNEISQISCFSLLNDCSLLELSAYLGSEKIFEYLNGKRLQKEIDEPQNLSLFVLFGQHPKIIKIFLNGIDSSNKGFIFEMLSVCMKHNFTDTYDMIINTIADCPKPTVSQLDQYMKKCVSRGYFENIPNLLKEGANINVLLNLFCKANNEIGIEYMLEFSYVNVNAPYKNMMPLEYCLEGKNALGSILLLNNDFINVQAIDNKSQTGETIIHTACHFGLARVVSYLLRKHLYDVNLQTKEGMCPIHYACWSGNYETVTAVIRGKRVHIRTKVKSGQYMKRTALHFACCSGNPRIITLLLDSDERLGLDDVDCKERTPIICAIKDNFADCVRILLEQEEIDINQEYKGNNLLQYACIKNHNEVFDVILNAIVFDPDQPCSDGRVILVVAIENKNSHIVKSILDKFEHSVNVNIDTNEGKTPLITACEMGELEIVKHLFDHDDIDIEKPATSDGTTPFMAAAKSGNIELLNLFKKNQDDFDIYATNKVGMNAMHMAFFAEKMDAVKYLLPLFADKLNDKTKNGETLLQIACKRGNIELSKLLINQPGVDVNVHDINGMTPFLSGVQEGKIELVKALVESNDCNINEKTNDGRNAFLISVQTQNLELVKYFIELYANNNQSKGKNKSKSKSKKQENVQNNNSVDINAKTAEDRSALFIALKLQNKEILKELINCPLIDINEASRDRTFLCKLVKKMSAFHHGNSFDYNEILDLVLARTDLDINKPSLKYNNQTCLHIPCKSQNHNIKLFNKLYNIKGIDKNAQSGEGSPLFLLIKYQSSYFRNENQNNDSRNGVNQKNIVNDSNKEESENESSNSDNESRNSDNYSSALSSDNDSDEVVANNNNFNNDFNNNFNSNMNMPWNQNNQIDINDETNFWGDILNDPKLDVNKGGNPEMENIENMNLFNIPRNKANSEKKEEYETPLELAIQKRYSKIAEALLSKKGIDINSNSNSEKRTPLHLAIISMDVNLINILLSKKEIKVNIQDKTGSTPLLLAVETYELTDVSLNILNRKDVIKGINLSDEKTKITPFLAAVTNPDMQIFNSILNIKGVDLEAKDKKGRTGFYLLVKNLYLEDIKDIEERIIILHQKCPSLLNIPNKSGKTPLFRAIERCCNSWKVYIDVISYLLDQDDIDLSLPEEIVPNQKKASDEMPRKYTSLLHVACNNSNPVIVEKLIPIMRNYYAKKGTKESIFVQKDEQGNSILNIACFQKDIKTIDIIINYVKNPENGINYNDPNEFDINAESWSGMAPLHSICQMESSELSLSVLNNVLTIESLNINAQASNGLKTALHFASFANNKDMVEALINFNPEIINPNIYDNSGNTPLLIATSKNESGIVKRLLKHYNIDVNSPLPLTNKTPLYIACENWKVKIVERLLSHPQTNVNCQISPSGKTPLMFTIESFKIDLFHLLLNNDKIDLDVVDNDKLSVLHYACRIGKVEFIKEIISKKIESSKNGDISDYLQAQTNSGLTPLHYVCMSNNKEAILYLLELNRKNGNGQSGIYIRDNNGLTPYGIYLNNPAGQIDPEINDAFMLENTKDERIETNANIFKICENGHYEIIKFMISDLSIDLNDNNNKEKKTLLHILCQNQKNDLIIDLLKHKDKINFNAVDVDNMTPLHTAVIFCFNADIVQLLLKTNKCDINARDNKGRTPLHYACEKGTNSIIKELLKYNKSIDINAQDKNGSTPLHEVAKSLRFDINILEMLFNSNCNPPINPNMTDKNGNTPLHLACMKENNMFVSSLINLSTVPIDVNIVNKKYQTPLFIVCMKNDSLIYNTLFSSKLQNEIDINLTSPIYIAALKCNFFLVEKMLDMPGIDLNSNKIENQSSFNTDTENDIENENINGDDEEEEFIEFDFSGLNLLHIISLYDSATDILKKLIEMNQFDINEPTAHYVESKMNGTPLIIALKNNNIKNLYLLLDHYNTQLDLSIYDRDGLAAVHYCFKLSNNGVNILQNLIDIDNNIINMETNNDERETPLLSAFKNRNIDCAILLLQQPSVNVFCYNKNNDTPIHFAASENRKDIIDFVLMKIKSSMNDGDLTEKDVIDFVNSDNNNGETPLLIGCKNSNIYVVQTLIDTFKDNLDFAKSDNNGTTPFLAALHKRNDELIHLLLLTDNCVSTIDLSVPVDEENNYIVQLMAKNSNLENFKLAIEQASGHSSNMNIDFYNIENNRGESLITIAANQQNLELFNYICDNQNPDLNVLVDGVMPLLFKAADSYDIKIFESILSHGSFDLNQKFDGKTVLHFACESPIDAEKKVKLLIKQDNIDVNCPTSRGSMTPLHLAVKKKNADVVEALLSLDGKININVLNSKKRSPRDMATNRTISKLFIDYDIRNKKK